MDLSGYIRERMDRDGITQVHLAGLLGVPQSEVSRRLHNKVSWQLADLPVVAELFGIPTHELLRAAEAAEPEAV